MSQPILIAVGGTGQNVLAAYLRLAAMAGFTPAPCYVVDSDTKGPQFTALSVLEPQVRRLVGGVHNSRWHIHPFPIDQSGHESFGELFRNLGEDGRHVFDCLFSEEAEKTSIRDGMYGRPAIGATSMRLKLERGDDDLREMRRMLAGDKRQIVLVGSCFGGTGSGAVPILAKEFKRLSEREPGFNLEVRAVVFLPWFRLSLPEGDMGRGERHVHDHLDRNFEPNAAASIRFFQDTLRNFVETVTFIGMRDPSGVRRESQEWKQKESVHALNLLAAVLVQNFLGQELQAPRGVTGYWCDAETGLDAAGIMVSVSNKTTSLKDIMRRGALQQRWLGILAVFFQNYFRLPGLHRPIFVEVALERMRNRGIKASELTAELALFFSEGKAIHDEIQRWLDNMMGDKTFFHLEAEGRQLQSEEYRMLTRDPLPFLRAWSDRGEVLSKFEATDFATPRLFAARFAERFLNHVGEHLSQ